MHIVTYKLHMEQKYYKENIVMALMNGKSHAREMARKLRVNHMMVTRKVSELVEDNVLDYRAEGKNKSYYIKDSIEARQHVIISEHYALLSLLKKHPELRMVIDKVQNDKRIKLALLFGSYSKGLAHKGSDIDIYIETNDQKVRKEYAMLDSKLSIKIGSMDNSSSLAREISKSHVVLKGVERYYETKGFTFTSETFAELTKPFKEANKKIKEDDVVGIIHKMRKSKKDKITLNIN